MNHPELIQGMTLIPCAVMGEWLYIPHADGKWVSAAKLQPFSQGIIRYWLAEPKPEATPVAHVSEVHLSRYTVEWVNGPLPEGTPLFATAPTPSGAPADTTKALTDAMILHRWDTHVGGTTSEHPLTDADKINFARAVLAEAALAGAPAVQDATPMKGNQNG